MNNLYNIGNMNNLKKIMKIRKYEERDIALRKYAQKLGVSTQHLVNPVTAKTSEPELVDRIRKVEEHNRTVRNWLIGSAIAILTLVWTIIYSLYLYPPRYVFDHSKLKLEMNLSSNYAEFKLRFVLRNKNRGEGDITKPALIVNMPGNIKKFELQPQTTYIVDTKTTGNMVEVKTDDSGKIIHMRGYGIIDQDFEYKLYQDRDKEILEFLKANKDKLQFKIKGEPYNEVSVLLDTKGELPR